MRQHSNKELSRIAADIKKTITALQIVYKQLVGNRLSYEGREAISKAAKKKWENYRKERKG